MKNYYGGESGPRDKVIYKCSCGCREMYKPIDCSKDWKEFRKIAAYLLGVSCVILTTDFLFFDFSFSDLKIWAGVSAGLSIWSFLYALTRYSKWKHWKEAQLPANIPQRWPFFSPAKKRGYQYDEGRLGGGGTPVVVFLILLNQN